MPKFNFTKHKTVREGYIGCHVGNIVYASAGMVKKMDYPKYIEVAYDNKAKAIMLIGHKEGGVNRYKVSRHKTTAFYEPGGSMGLVQIGRKMPRGRYYFTEQTKEGFICVKK